jgi:cbb3-type cytochrome c oxidase subunit II
VGGKYPSLWHIRHMRQPDSTTPGSIMPRYPHLLTSHYDTSLIGAKMRALQTLGVPYTDGEIETAVADMARQAAAIAAEVEAQKGPTGLVDREIIALTAYLQRLGTDIKWKKPVVAPASAASGTPAGTSAGQAAAVR